MRFGSVCSGIEAASTAWEPLGWEAAWFSEIEPFPCAVLKHRHPRVPNHGDMTTLPARILAGEVEAPDVLVGGTPCQSFSVAGLRQGLKDPRGQLTRTYVEICDAIDTVRSAAGKPPVILVWENVPGVLSDNGNAFGNFLGALSGEDGALQPPGGKWTNAGLVCGPTRDLAWRVLDAQYFGVAQRRRRVFLVGHSRAGALRPVKVLLVEQGVQRHSAPSREAGQRAAPTLAARTRGGGGDGAEHDGGVVCGTVCPTLRAGGNQTGGNRPPGTDVDTADSLIASAYANLGAGRDGGRGGVAPQAHVVAPPLTASNDPSRSPQSSEVTQQVEAVLRAQYPEVAEVCGTISDGAHNGGGLNGQDAYTGRILPVAAHAVHENQRAEVTLSPVVGTLKCAGGKPGQGYPTVLAADACVPSAVPYDLFQITAPINRQNRDERSPCHTLARDNAAHAAVVQPLAFDARQSDVCVYGEKIGVCATGDRTHALTRCEGATEDGTGRDTPIVPARSVALRGRDGGATAELGGEQAGTLRASTGGGDKPHVLASMSVRRLTPTECERLQGFPDGWTQIAWKGKAASECPDGPRYKALGNSMAVPVMRWIGWQIQKAMT